MTTSLDHPPEAGPTASPDLVPSSLEAGRADRWILAAAMLPFLVTAITQVVHGQDLVPAGDLAATELLVGDVGNHEVLIGLWSRSDWSHPGPLWFYVCAPVYWLFGREAVGLAVAAVLVNAASVLGIGILARRRGGTPLLVASLLGSLLLVRTLGGGFVASYWNLHITTLPFALLVFLTWSILCRDRWAIPVAAFVASLLAQTHVGFVPVAFSLFGAALAGLTVQVWRDRSGQDGPGGRDLVRPALAAVAVLGVVWLPPLIDELTAEPSNADRILRYFRGEEEPTQGLGVGMRVVLGQLELAPEWLVDKRAPAPFTAQSPFHDVMPLPLGLLVVAGAGWALWRWGPRSARSLLALLVVAVPVSIVAVSRTAGPVFDYRLLWTWVVPMTAFVAVLWAAWTLATRRWPGRRDLLLRAGVAALGVVVLVDVVAGVQGRLEPGDSEIMASLTPQVVDGLERSLSVDDVGDIEGQVLVQAPYSVGHWQASGLQAELERRGVDVRVDAQRAVFLGRRREIDAPPVADLVVAPDAAFFERLEEPGLELLAWWSTYEEAEWDDLQDRLAAIDKLGRDLAAGELTVEEWADRNDAVGLETRGDLKNASSVCSSSATSDRCPRTTWDGSSS
ncbi:MAG: hypothetical protein H0V42_06195 [Nocardioidaceae bacterium]|nr:hypothetical protein [Nocardioidaceae bacterium]